MKPFFLLFEILVGIALSFLLTTVFFSNKINFEDQALGTETVTWPAVDSVGNPIHILHLDPTETDRLIKYWHDRGSKEVILIFGNSQTHSINQRKDGEVVFVELLHNRLKKLNMEILSVSFPNASLQEFFLAYNYLKQRLKIGKVIVPVFFDDMREDGLRDVYFPELISERYQIASDSTELKKKINGELQSHFNKANPASGQANSTKPDLAALKATFQERSESLLNQFLNEHFAAWQNRANVRGYFFVWLYQLRNTVFGINASTIRKMIPNRYQWNWQALLEMTEDCSENKIDVLLYVPPLRFDLPIPYDIKMYNDFKIKLAECANANPRHLQFKNYESIIPGNLWGYKGSTNLISKREADYMHFKYKGHQILADSLFNVLNKQVK